MRYSRLASFLGVLFSLVMAIVAPVIDVGRYLAREILHIDFGTARIERDTVAREIDAVPIAVRFKAFVARALDHARFSAGRFDLARSTPA